MNHYKSFEKILKITNKNKRAIEIVHYIVSTYNKKLGVFKNRINAEDFVPKNTNSKEKALFLFYVIQIDYAMKSERLYKGAIKLLKYDKKYFNPKVILNLKQIKLKSIIKKFLNPRYINEAVNRWKKNSKVLIEEYKGDPIDIFKHSNNALPIEKEIRKFRGFGPKIGNFFFRTMVNTFNFKLKNIDKITQPVDRHDIRLTYEWGLIGSKEINDKNIKMVKEILQKACIKAKKSWLVFDRAMWIMGSKKI